MTQAFSGQGRHGRRAGPVVVVDVGLDAFADGPKVVVTKARELGWRLLNLNFRAGSLPDNLVPVGAIVSRPPGDPRLRRLLKLGCPVVRLGSMPHPADRLAPAVIHDLRAAGHVAADHFAERGFKHVGYVGRIPWSGHKALYDGFKERAEERGCKVHLLRHEQASAPADLEARYLRRRALFAAWLRSLPRPLGLLAFADGEAALFCAMCFDEGIAVPDDVAILGCGNIPSACECSLPTLSSIVLDHVGRAEAAVHMLQQLMAGRPPVPTTVMIPPVGVVVRESTDLLAVADRTVAAILRHVWDHLDRNQSVADMARQFGVSRRTIERGFRTQLGRGVAEERLRKRLEVLAELLRKTDEPVIDLAERVGFRTLAHMHKSFCSRYGMTPRQYRISPNSACPPKPWRRREASERGTRNAERGRRSVEC